MPSTSTTGRPQMQRSSRAPAFAVGPDWEAKGFRQVGWALLPLRGFLGITFIVAALQKLANPGFFDPHNPISFASVMHSLRHTSPIGPLLAVSAHAPTLVGLSIALGELAVGVGVLVGLWTRLAAVGGLLLSLTFFLTVSWNTSPYYYGSDIVFGFAWTPFITLGAAGVLSVDAWISEKAQQRQRSRQSRPAAAGGRYPQPESEAAVLTRRAVGVTAVAAGVLGAAAAVLGRLIGGTSTGGTSAASAGTPASTPTTAPSHHNKAKQPGGTLLGSASAVPAGHAALFRDPASGQPAYLVHEKSGSFAAFSAVCTHAGCTVGYDAGANQFICPCHGGTYSAENGQVLAGPPPAPLGRIPVTVSGGKVYRNA